MKRLITDIYKIIYKLTKHKLTSLSVAILYISTLNIITLYGASFLLRGLVPYIQLVGIAFRRPYIFGTILLIVGLNFWSMLPLQNLSKEKSKPATIGSIVVYSFISLLLFAYARYVERSI
jgi:hypothetical protein